MRRWLFMAAALFVASVGACVGDFAGLCRYGATECDGACVELASDATSCGACGVRCADGEQCVAGVCRPPCGALAACGGACVDVTSDARHCGACGNACGEGAICVSEACEPGCAGDSLVCGGACVDGLSDEARCGGCGTGCAPDEACTEGTCACFDTFADDANCGSCGNVCGLEQHCLAGACRLLCVGEACPPATVLSALRFGEDGAVVPVNQRDQAAVAADFGADGSAWIAFEARGDNYLFDEVVSAAPNGDILVARLDAHARVLERRLIGGAGNDRARALRVTADGGLVVAGTYSGDGAALCGLPTAISSDGFVVRLEPDGSCRWSVALSGSGVDELRDVRLSPGGDVLVTGWVSPVASLVPSAGLPIALAGNGADDAIAVAVSDAGDVRWERTMGGPLRERAYGLAVDGAGDVIVTGEYRGEIALGADVLAASDSDQDALMAVKLAGPTGDIVWGRGFPITSTPAGHNAQGIALATTADDHVWVLGDFVGAIGLGESTTVSSFLTSRDLLLLELDADGVLLQHERIGNEDVEEAASVLVDEAGHVLIAGAFRQSLSLGSETLEAVNGRDVFVAALEPQEGGVTYLFSRSFGGQRDERPRAIAVHQGLLLLMGTFESDIDFGLGPMWSPWGETDTIAEVRDDGFVAVLSR